MNELLLRAASELFQLVQFSKPTHTCPQQLLQKSGKCPTPQDTPAPTVGGSSCTPENRGNLPLPTPDWTKASSLGSRTPPLHFLGPAAPGIGTGKSSSGPNQGLARCRWALQGNKTNKGHELLLLQALAHTLMEVGTSQHLLPAAGNPARLE